MDGSETNLDQIRFILFDWDGVLRDSMNPRIEAKPWAFAQAIFDFYGSLRSHDDDIRDLYVETSGLSRFVQLERVITRYGLPVLPYAKQVEWGDSFDQHTDSCNIPLFTDSIPTVKELKQRSYFVGLSSSVPQTRLDRGMVKYPDLSQHLDIVLGSRRYTREPGTKPDFHKGLSHSIAVCSTFNLDPSEIATVMDAVEDARTTREGGMHAIGLSNHNIPGQPERLEGCRLFDLLINAKPELLTYFTGPPG